VIPQAAIHAWRSVAAWATDVQVEQDLVLARILVEMFRDGTLAEHLAFRGGTALHKLFLAPAARYSEDIDLVQVKAGPIGPAMNGIRSRLDGWLGSPSWKQGHGRVTLYYRFEAEGQPDLRKKLKIEINTREHTPCMDLIRRPFSVRNLWFDGAAEIPTFALAELLGTKLRALYQRKKGRDLFDLWEAGRRASLDPAAVVRCMLHYLAQEGRTVSRAEFEANLQAKRSDALFRRDMEPLLDASHAWDFDAALTYVLETFVTRLPGEPFSPTPTRSRTKVVDAAKRVMEVHDTTLRKLGK
jgi:predicted nucleotidyltransferase component of viral defense system